MLPAPSPIPPHPQASQVFKWHGRATSLRTPTEPPELQELQVTNPSLPPGLVLGAAR